MRSKDINYKEERERAYKRQVRIDQAKERKRERENKEFENILRNEEKGIEYVPGNKGTDSEPVFDAEKAYKQFLIDEANDRDLYKPFMRIAHLMRTAPESEELKTLMDRYMPMDENGVIDSHLGNIFEAVMRDSEAFKKRTQRLSDYAKYLISFAQDEKVNKKSCLIFVTLTFTDEVLKSTSEETRRRYVSRCLAQISPCYLVNKDYGGQNGREHYHGLIVSDMDTKKLKESWKYGWSDFKTVRANQKDVSKVSKYINKLKNHAVKASTKNEKIIYSRNRPRIYGVDDDYRVNTESGWLID